MKKAIFTFIAVIILALIGYNFFNSEKNNSPISFGPDTDTSTITGPTSEPVTNDNLKEIERSQQQVDTKYTNSAGEEQEITLIFNIKEDQIKGILLRPRFTDDAKRASYHKLTEQTIYKDIEGLEIQPAAELPEFSKAYIKALDKAIKMYEEKKS